MEMQRNGSAERLSLPKLPVAMGGAGLLGAAALGARNSGGLVLAQGAPFRNDIEVLNYALTLEFFEAELYRVLVASGKLQGRDLQYITLFGQQEQAHVDALIPVIQQLGGTPVQKAQYNFPTLNTREEVLDILIVVEQTGVGAYLGAAGFLQNKDLLAAAASIMQVEARHTSLVRLLRGLDPVPSAFTPAIAPADVLKAVDPFFKK
jgi:hypothetical protein